MYEIKVSGMTCGGCAGSITNALKSLDSKAQINIDLNSQTVQINTTRTKEEISLAIKEAGFEVLDSKQIR